MIFRAALDVLSVLFVVVPLVTVAPDTSPVMATDAADTFPAVDIEPPEMLPVAVIIEVYEVVFPPILPCDAVTLPLKDTILPNPYTPPVDAVNFPPLDTMPPDVVIPLAKVPSPLASRLSLSVNVEPVKVPTLKVPAGCIRVDT